MKTTRYILILLIIYSCSPKNYTDKELFDLYESNLKEDKYKDAADYITVLIQRYPDRDTLYYKRTLAYSNFKTQNSDSLLLADLNKCIELSPNKDKYRYLRALTYARAKDYESAAKDYEIIVNNHPDLLVFLAEKAKIHFMAKQFDKAIKDYEKLLTNNLPYPAAEYSYYYLIYSKYFGKNKSGAMWDCAFLPDRGFKEDTILMRKIADDKLRFLDVAVINFMTVYPEQLDKVFGN